MRIEGTVAERPAKLKARHVRAQLQITQDELERRSGITRKVISDIEHNKRAVSLNTAYALLNTFNEIRRGLGQPELAIDDLDWKITGESEE